MAQRCLQYSEWPNAAFIPAPGYSPRVESLTGQLQSVRLLLPLTPPPPSPSPSPGARNPCWFENKKLRCIPYYHILGVSKCGTTDIYNRLVKHPHIYESLNKVWACHHECSSRTCSLIKPPPSPPPPAGPPLVGRVPLAPQGCVHRTPKR